VLPSLEAMAETTLTSAIRDSSRPLQGPLAAAAGLVLALACLMDWANVRIVVFTRWYTGTHFGEGRLTLGLAIVGAVVAAIAALWLPRLAYLLPLVAAAALALTTRKYHEVGRAFSSFHGFRLAHASAGNGLLLAILASTALLTASLLGVADRLRLAPRLSRTPSEVQ
jgi:hypothetical protein